MPDGICVRANRPDAALAAPVAPSRCVDPGPTVPRRLSAEEYRNTVTDLLGVAIPFDPPAEDPEMPVADSATAPAVPPALRSLGEQIAGRAVAMADRLTGCDPAGASYASCLQGFLERLGRRAFRRPLAAKEQADIGTAFETGRSAGGPVGGLQAALAQILGAPPFLYRLDLGEAAAAGARNTPLTPWERASRLSYFLWRTMPDAALFAAAESGALRDAAEVQAQTQRLLRDERAAAALASFHRRWLELDVEGAQAGTPGGPSAPLRTSIMRSADMLFASLIWREDADLGTLLGFPSLYGDRPMAGFYDLSPPAGDGLEMLSPRGGQIRRGLITTPAFLATFSHGVVSAPVRRGRIISDKLLCKTFLPPATGVPPVESRPGMPAPKTTRQLYAEHTSNPACSFCHQYFDPIGFGLENYDGFGRWRTSENGHDIDASGVIYGTSFQGPAGLVEYLAAPENAPHCLVVQLFRQAMGRAETDADDCTLAELQTAFQRGGERVQPLLLAITGSQAFLTRRAVRP
jgi:hypothetical protein